MHASYSRVFMATTLLAVPLLLTSCSSANSRAVAQAANTPASASKPDATTQASKDGGLEHEIKPGETTLTLARRYLSQSSLMTVAELDEAIHDANGIARNGRLQPRQKISIPTLEAQPIVEHPHTIANDSDIRAIYLTGATAGSATGLNLVRRWHEAGGNAVVFDIKDSDGGLSIAFDHPLAPARKSPPSIGNLPKYVRYLHSMNMHAIARIALFRDDHIAQHHTNLAVRSRATGEPWRENGKLVWADPSNAEVQQYNLALAKHVAQSGADEIQFDYVRFPAEGNQKDAKFAFESAKDAKPLQRKDVIANFLDKAYSELHPMGVLVSIDVFGIMAWQRTVDLAHTGQDIREMVRHCDVLSPMIYPSHFFGMDGYTQPGDAPEHFIAISMERFQKIASDSKAKVAIRPWLQAFGWKTSTYSPDYIRTQVAASKQKGGVGFLLWNARNDYAKPLAAMPVMIASANKYFGKGQAKETEIPHATADVAPPHPARTPHSVPVENSATKGTPAQAGSAQATATQSTAGENPAEAAPAGATSTALPTKTEAIVSKEDANKEMEPAAANVNATSPATTVAPLKVGKDAPPHAEPPRPEPKDTVTPEPKSATSAGKR